MGFEVRLLKLPKSVEIEKYIRLYSYAQHADNVEDAHDTKLLL